MFTSEEVGEIEAFSSGEFSSGTEVWDLPTLDGIQQLQNNDQIDPAQNPEMETGLDPVGLQTLEEETTESTTVALVDQEVISSEELKILKEIRDSLKNGEVSLDSETETVEQHTEVDTEATNETESTESTTSYYVIMDDRLQSLENVMEIQARDQQLIGKLSVGCMVVLIGAFVVYLFLGRIR